MGLRLTLDKSKNRLCFDFANAYWSIENISYSTTNIWFTLSCYPSREAKLSNAHDIGDNTHRYKTVHAVNFNGNLSGNATTATTASGVAWTNVSGKPTKLSQFTNDSGYITVAQSSTREVVWQRQKPL